MAVATDDPTDDPDSPPAPNFLWKNLFTNESLSHSPSSSPTFLPDGTPVVIAPPSVILKASEAWTGYLVCNFLGEPPSPAKIFSDLNPVWGRKGAITVRRFSQGSCLVFVPSASHRKWILEAGLWSSGNVAFTVTEWSVTSSFTPAKLTSAPTVVTLHGVPPQLWSQRGVETIAGGVAKLIPNARASLPLSSLGTAKIRAIVPLGPELPSTIIVQDSHGDTVRVSVEYGRLPILCPSCLLYGHSKIRCPSKHSKNSTPPSHIKPSSSPKPHITDEIPPQVSVEHPPPPQSVTDTSVQEEEEEGGTSHFVTNPNPPDGPLKPIQDHLPSKDFQPNNSPTISRGLENQLDSTINSGPITPLASSLPFADIAPSKTSDEASLRPQSTDALMTQIKTEINAAFSTPRLPPPVNTHLYFSTPSTTSQTVPASPPSVSFRDFYEEVLSTIPKTSTQQNDSSIALSKKKKGDKCKKQPSITFEEEGETNDSVT